MSDALLPYYERELNALRRLAAEFAAEHPKIAGRLRISPDSADDPHVARLLEGVAFLGARVHHRLDDEFPELTDSLLGVLYPHYLAPFPSSAIAQLQGQADVMQPLRLPAGLAVNTEPVRGEVCRFRTAWPVVLWPIEIEAVRLGGLPLVAPTNPLARGAVASLRITLRCRSPEATFAALSVDRLRFFLRGPPNLTFPLYELLCAHTLSVAYADGANDPAPVVAWATALEPAGFSNEEGLIPWPARSFSGFRLLSEYFAFPDKFLFVDISGIEAKSLVSGGNKLEIFIYLDRAAPELERMMKPDSLALGCVPLVNLFTQRCEPIRLSHTETEYRIVPDARRVENLEVWQVERVRETQADGATRRWQPFYRLSGQDQKEETPGAFYYVTRRGGQDGGREAFLATYDREFSPDAADGSVLSIEALCTNRDLPSALPFGGGHPELKLVEQFAAVTNLTCVVAPTSPLRPPPRERRFWRLISHLSIGHLSLVGGEEGAAALREVLRLYDLREAPETRGAIDALVGVRAEAGVARAPGGRSGAFCRGTDVQLEFDAKAWESGSLFLFASVLERFLALHVTINSFTRVTATLRGRPGIAAAWPARAGTRVLL